MLLFYDAVVIWNEGACWIRRTSFYPLFLGCANALFYLIYNESLILICQFTWWISFVGRSFVGMCTFKVDVGNRHLISLHYRIMVLFIYTCTTLFNLILKLLVESYSVHRCQHNLQEQIKLISFSYKLILTHASLLVDQWHNITLHYVMIIYFADVVFNLPLLCKMWILKAR